mmetsp:Transcript_9514/g.17941  ORF Transcript_9514/g.17941 Transcript_9514/m.17941 type:complete len:352 (-) Transcript_9514:170-1225(-)|eukprot:CAMPEP_0203755358 /NCGR_PEP_ID=MMETSP0098-20131031/8821_1 /ASSEMBLY_ACC=CAM_ASM_000208 /TAXON_ID=96639 /ORGANISM=" , Strain NY0313808BC1" /LENGTH=351 /DNA_ID=CAMNT_0050646783 /DNA_START=63 /DNA_END=1118 /DNA_ORIENTATION=-
MAEFVFRKKSSTTRMKPGMSYDDISRISQSNSRPPSENFDEVASSGSSVEGEREILFNRLQKFYSKWEPDRVQQGIGHIVDWAMSRSDEVLNYKLFEKYGENLEMFEKRSNAIKLDASPQPAETFIIPSKTSTIRDRLTSFYNTYDPQRLEKGIDDLIDFVSREGLPALNRKLFEKYGTTLECFEQGIEPRPTVKPKKSVGLNMQKLLRRSFRRETQATTKRGELPLYVRPLLEMFYSKYDPSKLKTGGVDAIYEWTSKNGLNALNLQLHHKYREDLDEFADKMCALREDLIAFYTKHDPEKIQYGGVDPILRWGISNGRAAINRQLQLKYGWDLDQGPSNSVFVDEEPNF